MVLTIGAGAGIDAISMKLIAGHLLIWLYSTSKQALRVLYLLDLNHLGLFLYFVNAAAWSAVEEEICAAMIRLHHDILRSKHLVLSFVACATILNLLPCVCRFKLLISLCWGALIATGHIGFLNQLIFAFLNII